jgi:hypothetical protein
MKIDQMPVWPPRISLSGKLKARWSETASLREVTPKRKAFAWIYGEPYKDQGKWWVDYEPNGTKNRVLKRMSYDDFLKSNIDQFKQRVNKGDTVLFPDPAFKRNGGSGEQTFLVGTVTPLGPDKVLLKTADGKKFTSSYKNLFFWNGYSTSKLDGFFDFFRHGGKGAIVRMNLPHDAEYDGQYVLVADQLPATAALRKSLPGLARESSYDALRTAQAEGTRVVLTAKLGAAMLPSQNHLLLDVDTAIGRPGQSKHGIVIGTESGPGSVEHELQHLSDWKGTSSKPSAESELWDSLIGLSTQQKILATKPNHEITPKPNRKKRSLLRAEVDFL